MRWLKGTLFPMLSVSSRPCLWLMCFMSGGGVVEGSTVTVARCEYVSQHIHQCIHSTVTCWQIMTSTWLWNAMEFTVGFALWPWKGHLIIDHCIVQSCFQIFSMAYSLSLKAASCCGARIVTMILETAAGVHAGGGWQGLFCCLPEDCHWLCRLWGKERGMKWADA